MTEESRKVAEAREAEEKSAKEAQEKEVEELEDNVLLRQRKRKVVSDVEMVQLSDTKDDLDLTQKAGSAPSPLHKLPRLHIVHPFSDPREPLHGPGFFSRGPTS